MIPAQIEVVDSHTEGEPTRVVIGGWPEPRGADVASRREYMLSNQDDLRTAVVLEPRGHDAVVGALLVPADRPDALTGVVFFNSVGYLGMCGHGLIGVVRTLQFLGRATPGEMHLDTPVGRVSAQLADDGSVTIRNVAAHLHRRDVSVDVPGVGTVTGDIAWGGNWFFLASLDAGPLVLSRQGELMRITRAIRDALSAAGITGANGAEIDHVELFSDPHRADARSRNFVLCPGDAYDRSPCGTGTSAKMAALHHRGDLAIGERWQQESVVGSMFTGWLEEEDGQLIPHIQGRAYVTARSTLLFDRDDPFRTGLR